MKTMVVGIAGGTGSGKTSVAKSVMEQLHQGPAILGLDNFYHDFRHLTIEERAFINYDHPNAFDIPLLLDALDKLKHGEPAEEPVYDYKIHGRSPDTNVIQPAKVIIVEGILTLAFAELRSRLDVKIFVDADSDVRFIRRLTRDMNERSRSAESITKQYLNTVRPMHLEFVEPSKRYADIIVPEGGHNTVAIDFITTKLKTMMG